MRKQHTKFEIQNIFMIKRLNINKIDKYFHGWRVADARVVGGKNTHNGMGRLLLTSNTNKGTKYFHGWRVADARVVGGKNTHNGMGRLLLTSNTNKGTKERILGDEVKGFEQTQKVFRNKSIDFWKIFRGPAKETWGGITQP